MKNNSGKSPKSGNAGGVKSDARKDRKFGTRMYGSPKKGGHGGKFTWARDKYSEAEMGNRIEVVDSKDPNFEDSEVTTATSAA